MDSKLIDRAPTTFRGKRCEYRKKKKQTRTIIIIVIMENWTRSLSEMRFSHMPRDTTTTTIINNNNPFDGSSNILLFRDRRTWRRRRDLLRADERFENDCQGEGEKKIIH